MSTDHLPSLYDARGFLDRAKIAASDLSLLTEPELSALDEVVETSDAVEAAELRLVQARRRMAELSAAHDAAHNAVTAVRGPIDAVDQIKKVIAIHNGVSQREPTIDELTGIHAKLQSKARALDAKVKSKGSTDDDAAALKNLMSELVAARVKLEKAQAIEVASATYDQAVVDLAEIRVEYHAADNALRPARDAHSKSLLRWDGFRQRLTQLDLARAAAQKTNDERLAAYLANPPSTDPNDTPISKAFAAKRDVQRSTRRAYAPPPAVRGSLVPQPVAPRPTSSQRSRS
ncbi:hypothetical protein [Bradyrhizobium genosp. P]|uniref:hypothetical protein n=1 Tax=Bradyrhizobium genosp. P TaxID=83641 RepID=UPI003CF83736